MPVGFEWDEEKAAGNWEKHRVRFETATRAFTDPFALVEQDRVVDGELRWHLIGLVDDTLMLLIAHVVREKYGQEVTRIISARRAVPKERRRYDETNGSIQHRSS